LAQVGVGNGSGVGSVPSGSGSQAVNHRRYTPPAVSKRKKPSIESESRRSHAAYWICALLIAGNLAIYGQVVRHPFVDFDDDLYVSKNPNVQSGLTADGVSWAFRTFHAANWHPVTWLSHMVDVELFGMNPGGHHATNLVLHIFNTLLVFGLLRRMTKALWPSAVAAALFAVHPMHVESVAWVAERKDVLSTFFWLLTILAYTRYADDTSSWRWYAATVGAFAVGLMAKPMLVTLPFVLLLLDHWPLRRFDRLLPLLREKLPLFALSVASSVVTYIAQSSGGAMQDFRSVPFSYRVANVLVSYALYLYALIWPQGLAVYYPYPSDGRPLAAALSALALLAAVTWLAIRSVRQRPYLLTGWFWYLGTMVPVIGLVQVGGQSMADRYSYVPFIGLSIMIAWSVADLRVAWRVRATAAAVVLVVLGSISWTQARYWSDSATLFERALAVTHDNATMEYNLGQVLGQRGHPDQAMQHFQESLRIWPEFYSANYNMGVALAASGNLTEASDYYRRALAQKPDSVEARVNLAVALAQQGLLDAAQPLLEDAVRLDPKHPGARLNLGLVLLHRGRVAEATAQLFEAVRLDPASPEAHNNLGLAQSVAGNDGDAIREFTRALELRPDYPAARDNLRRVRAGVAQPDRPH
jgi:tetratricopeptide (TPR) repeat protein